MADAKILRIYLDETPLVRAQRGNFNLINKIIKVFEACEYRVELKRNSAAERAKSADRRGYSLFHMDEPFHERALTLRKAYYYPFWRIENSEKRWEWSIAKARFEPGAIPNAESVAFCDFWRRNLFKTFDELEPNQGIVYIPLQGRLLEQRSFQTASPLAMIEQVLHHDRHRQVVVSLHPGEAYVPDETDALKALVSRHPRLSLSSEPMEALLTQCDYVATENSSVALAGYFFHKPAVLFARIDFHHIAANVAELGTAEAIRAAPGLKPEYDKYLCWFLRHTAINGGSEKAEAQILEAVRRHGWNL